MIIRPVSVIVCTHNRGTLLPRVLGQIRGQNYPRDAFEIIVVDHHSIDNTRQVVQRLTEEPGVPIRYVAEPRHGITLARNRGAEEAHYPYLAYLDDDCTVKPDWLKQIAGGFELDERVVAVGGQVLLHWDHPRPSWLSSEMDTWMAANGYLGNHPRILSINEHIVEGNMAVNHTAWKAAGGFLGMEQFGSRNMAAGEVLFLQHKLYQQGGKIAFVPDAIAYHHVGKQTLQQMVQRLYWQGVSDAIFDHILHRRPTSSTTYNVFLDLLKVPALLELAALSYFSNRKAKSMFHLARAVRRIGLLLGEMHLAGDWKAVATWLSKQNPD